MGTVKVKLRTLPVTISPELRECLAAEARLGNVVCKYITAQLRADAERIDREIMSINNKKHDYK